MSEHIDLLEDPDGAPYPEQVQVLWERIQDVVLFDMNEPTRETVVAALESVTANATIARVRALHSGHMHAPDGKTWTGHCLDCGKPWPCPTIRILDGEETW